MTMPTVFSRIAKTTKLSASETRILQDVVKPCPRKKARRGPRGPLLESGSNSELEHEAQRELEVAHLVLRRGAGDLARVRPQVAGVADRVVGLAEGHVVEEVHDLHS